MSLPYDQIDQQVDLEMKDKMKTIPLTRGFVATVDDEDYEWISANKWQASLRRSSNTVYAVRRVRLPGGIQETLYMHREIAARKYGDLAATVDHADLDGLNNTRDNLRLATVTQQGYNQGLKSNNTSGYKGVFLSKSDGRFEASIGVDGKKVHIGMYATPEEAARAYDLAALTHAGEFARLNFESDKASYVEQLRNPSPQVRLSAGNTTGYMGVSRVKGKDRFCAQIQVGKYHRNLGYFSSAEDAARARDREALSIRGQSARLNFEEDRELYLAQLATHSCQTPLMASNTSGYKGVSLNVQLGKFEAYMRINGKKTVLGYFLDKEDAARAYDLASLIHRGPDAWINFESDRDLYLAQINGQPLDPEQVA